MKKLFITGAGGFIGKSCIEYFSKKYEITALDNYARDTHTKSKFKILNGSVFDQELMNKTVDESDIIIHMAAINGTRNFYERPKDVFEVSCRGALILYDALLQSENPSKKRVLIASSGEVYAQPTIIPTPENVELKIPDINNNRYSYGGGKITQDLIAKHLISKITMTTVFRPHNVYGPNMGFDHVIPELAKKIKISKDTVTIEGEGCETRSFCYIDDFMNGLNIVLENKQKSEFEVFNIGNDEEISINNLIKIIIKELGRDHLNIKKGQLREGGTSRRCPDIEKLKSLGYQPHFNITNGIKSFIKNDKLLSTL